MKFFLCVTISARRCLMILEWVLPDTTLVNFTYHVDGLKEFRDELRGSRTLKLFGQKIAVLPLDRICASKAALKRPKDRVHLFYLRQAMRIQKRATSPAKIAMRTSALI